MGVHRSTYRLAQALLLVGPVLIAVGVLGFWLGPDGWLLLASVGFAAVMSSLSVLVMSTRPPD